MTSIDCIRIDLIRSLVISCCADSLFQYRSILFYIYNHTHQWRNVSPTNSFEEMRVLNCTIVYLVRGEVNDGSERAFIVLIDILHRRLSEDEWWWLGRLWSFSSQGFFVFEQNFPLWSFLIMIISMSPESCEGDLNLIRRNMILFCLRAVVSPQSIPE